MYSDALKLSPRLPPPLFLQLDSTNEIMAYCMIIGRKDISMMAFSVVWWPIRHQDGSPEMCTGVPLNVLKPCATIGSPTIL